MAVSPSTPRSSGRRAQLLSWGPAGLSTLRGDSPQGLRPGPRSRCFRLRCPQAPCGLTKAGPHVAPALWSSPSQRGPDSWTLSRSLQGTGSLLVGGQPREVPPDTAATLVGEPDLRGVDSRSGGALSEAESPGLCSSPLALALGRGAVGTVHSTGHLAALPGWTP